MLLVGIRRVAARVLGTVLAREVGNPRSLVPRWRMNPLEAVPMIDLEIWRLQAREAIRQAEAEIARRTEELIARAESQR